MNGVLRPDLGNVVMIGVIAFVSVFLIDRGLRVAGFNTWTTSGA
jgi:hypothetical protein